MFVRVEAKDPLVAPAVRKLGSLTERLGMRMFVDDPAVFAGGDGWAEIDVPRATAEREAQEVVAALIDSIPAGPRALTIRPRAAPPSTRRQRGV